MQESTIRRVSISNFSALGFGVREVRLTDTKEYFPNRVGADSSPSERLCNTGALCKVEVSSPNARMGAYALEGLALIDPGSNISSINISVCLPCGITINEKTMPIASSTHTDYEQDTASFKLTFPQFNFSQEIVMGTVIPHLLETTGAIVLLGRDVLQHFKFNYNGPAGEVDLDLG